MGSQSRIAIENPHVDIKIKEHKKEEYDDVHIITPEIFDDFKEHQSGNIEKVLNSSSYTKINKVIAYNMIKNRLEMERQKLVENKNRLAQFRFGSCCS